MFVEMRQFLLKLFFFTFFSLALYFCELAHAQQYSFNYLTTKDGLSGSSILCIYNDSRGYTWIGTEGGGLCRYDGKKILVYSKEAGLVGNIVTCIAEDKIGNIWIGTLDGVSKFNGKEFSSLTKKNGLKSNSVYSIAVGADNKIYIASDGGGITIVNKDTISYLGKKEGLPTDTVYALSFDSKGLLWIGMGGRGLAAYDGNSIKRFSQFPDLCHNTYFSLCCDKNGNTWLGSPSGLVYKFDGIALQKIDLPTNFSGQFINNIHEDNWGAIWFGTQLGALKYKEGHFLVMTKMNGLSSNNITCNNSDREGNIWIGTFDAGVSIYTNRPITVFNETNGFENANINALLSTNDSNLLIGTSGLGLYQLRNNEIKKLITKSALDQSAINVISQNTRNEYMVGTFTEGVFFLDKNLKIIKQLKELKGLQTITQVLSDENERVVVSSYGDGFVLLDKSGNSILYNEKNSSLPSNKIMRACFTHDRKLLIGMFQKGLVEFDGKKFTSIPLPTTKENISVNSIICTKELCFIGTAEDGLFILTEKSKKKISEQEGICSNAINGMYWDATKRKLWLATNKGITILTLSLSNEIQKNDFLGTNNGLSCLETTVGNSIVQTQNGSVWIGTIAGLFKYAGKQENVSQYIPQVFLTELLLFNKETDWSKYADSLNFWNKTPLHLKLKYNENQLLFQFSAPGPEKNRMYQYMIQGYDKEWSPSLRYNEAIYSSLPPGTNYSFKVRLVSADGKTGPVTAFTFSISPPFWRTWWFYSIVGASLLISLYTYIRYREKTLLKEKKQLEEKVEERTNELIQTNELLTEAFTDIKDSINYAQRIQEAILPMESIIHAVLPDSFILFNPRDVVSGDFYWFGTVEKNSNTYHIIAAADCTGHGVPGAFMSMIGNTILSEIVIAKEIVDPSQILSLLHHGIRKALKQNLTTSRDGMDICLCAINLETNTVKYAGAYNPLWIMRQTKEIEIIKANKCAIGGFTEDNQLFESHTIHLQKGEAIYLFTDGYADQFGGEFGKKLSAKKFREEILKVADKPMSLQKFHLQNFVEIWKGNEFQVDDILVIGIRV